MTQQGISTVLQLIEEWVAQLSETSLNEQCRKSGMDFFSYMTAHGTSAAYLAKLITENVITEMMDQGETHWNHPGWNRDLWALLEEWAIAGNLIRVRLTAQWLLSTLPHNPVDYDMGDRLLLLSSGDFCSVFESESSMLYASREHYLKTLRWGVLPYLDAWIAEVRAQERRSP